MKRFIFILFGVLPLFETKSFGHGGEPHSQSKTKKQAPKTAEHEHKEWMFSVGLGWSYSRALTLLPSDSSTGQSKNTFLDEGHNHGGDGDSGGDPSSNSSIFAVASVSYMVTHSLSLSLSAGYDFTNSDLNDPALGLFNTKALTKRWSLGYGASLSAPLSRSSQKTYKITTLSLTAGPKYRWTKNFSMGLAGATSFSWYSKTIISEEELTEWLLPQCWMGTRRTTTTNRVKPYLRILETENLIATVHALQQLTE